MIIHCSGCGVEVEIPDELVGDVDSDEWNSGVITLNANYFCDECETVSGQSACESVFEELDEYGEDFVF